MMVRGSVDVLTGTEVIGWAFSPNRNDPVLVQAVLNHEILGEATANIYRPDLAAAGLGDGNSGYVIRLFRPIDPLYLPFVVVKIDGGDAELPRAPHLGFGDFFRALHAAHPSAGRSRSVFGGLWTDRTDAAALLRGKIQIGQIAPELATPIGQLIHEGVTIIDAPDPPDEYAWRDDVTARLVDALKDPTILGLLRAVLEDNPLAVDVAFVGQDEGLSQPSAANPSPSPAECVAVVVAIGQPAVLDLVRDSHRLPEFTPHGVSRWASRSASEALTVVGMNGMLDRRDLLVGQVAVIGPGTLYRARSGLGGAVVRSLCLPERGAGVGHDHGEVTRITGVRVRA